MKGEEFRRRESVCVSALTPVFLVDCQQWPSHRYADEETPE